MPFDSGGEPVITTEVLASLFERHVQYLENLDHSNPKLVICFGGVPGSGKSTLAKEIEKSFLGVRVSTDKIRDLLGEFDPNLDIVQKDSIVQKYHTYAMERLAEFPNGLLVLDSSIDRKYQSVFTKADEQGYSVYVVNFSLPRELLEQRIKSSKANPNAYLAEMDRWIKEHAEFEDAVTADVTLGEESSYETVLVNIEERLKAEKG